MVDPFNPRLKIRSDYLAATIVTLAPLVYFLPALVEGLVLSPDDGILQNVPLRIVAAQLVRSGSLPLWNPYIFGGMFEPTYVLINQINLQRILAGNQRCNVRDL